MKTRVALLGTAAAIVMAPAMALADRERGSSGHLNIIYWQAVSTMNPYLSGGTKEMNAASVVLEPLARFDNLGELTPWLVDEIPTLDNGGVAEDLKSITWTLTEGLLWSDGSPVTSADVVFSYEYCTHPEGGCSYRDRFAGIDRVEAVDDLTVTVYFEDVTPNPYLPFVGAGSVIIQQEQFQDCLGARAPECTDANFAPIGTGPYVVSNFRPNDVIEFVANENYRVPTQPYFETITWAGGGDANGAARAVFQTGEMDYAWNLQLAPEVIEQMEAGGMGELLVDFGPLMERIELNFTDVSPDLPPDERGTRAHPHPILSDIRVREALSRAIDRELLTEIGFGPMGMATCNFIVAPPAMASPNNDNCLVQDIDRANELLDEAGWERGPDGIRVKDGERLELLFQTSTNAVRQDFQALIQADWREIGVETRLRNIDAGVFFGSDPGSNDTYLKFFADAQMYASLFEGTDPTPHLEQRRCGREPQPSTQWQGQNINRYCNEEYDELWAELNREPDPDRRQELVIALNDMFVQDYAHLPLVARGRVSAASTTVGGIVMNVWDSEHWNQAEWYRIEE
ncbi:peptide ABC transporter substrate-binding protein [Roseinatronobacter monicus]|uniref:Peptide/nickel transport system substrate-binding protein n=1 Tax=Roseinatronobacter monicus TaxID=393481 RepID=A0A543K9S4_9RHOB|nr:peptide ABC transporter substrate-binding protein [Roseinatronobacter monicus]TQM91840.1 peptide/nickel transport system substrate-binding protein [Roseinatronobacter monicus]